MKELILKFIDELNYEKKYSEKTTDGYLHDLNAFLEYASELDIKNFNKVTYDDIRSYISYLHDLNYNNKTISRYISSLRSFFKYLKTNNYIDDNPCALIANPKLEHKLPKYLTMEEVENLLNVYELDSDINILKSLIIEMLYSTGIRVSELVNIKIKDIDLSSKEIKILGKGEKERIVYFGTRCQALLSNYINNSRNILNKYNLDYLLITKTGKQMSDRIVRKIIDEASIKANIKIKISPHVLRHTYATHMLSGGANLKTVKDLLGHENLSTTQIYTHVTNERLKNIYLNSHPRARK